MVGPGGGLTEAELQECGAFLALREFQKLGDRGIRKLVDERGSGRAALAEMEGRGFPRTPGPGLDALRGWMESG